MRSLSSPTNESAPVAQPIPYDDNSATTTESSPSFSSLSTSQVDTGLNGQYWAEPTQSRRANVALTFVPNTFDEIAHLPQAEKDKWTSAINSEIDSLTTKNTFKVIDNPPPNANLIDSKRVFKIKYNTDGSINKYKARLCARGFSQIKGIDYDNTWAPTGRYNSLRLFLSLVVFNNLDLNVVDVVTAFLNSKLDTPAFLKVPPGFPHYGQKYWRFQMTLYGLKQSPHLWNSDLNLHLKSCSFSPSEYDPCLYFRKEKDNSTSLVFVWVDDLLIASRTCHTSSIVTQLS